jgi:Flp pilus assembly pilin Flp
VLNTLKSLLANEAGSELAEYALLVSLIAIVALVSVRAFGKHVSALYSNASLPHTARFAL